MWHETCVHRGDTAAHAMTRKIDAISSLWPAPRRLARGPWHRMAWRDAGAPAGEPWLLLHGGPGSGCQPGLLAPFDLRRQRVLAPDQRSAGASRPRGVLAAHALGRQVADLEALRQHLALERWSLLAGSWGSVPALAYAQRHPARVQRLVLRGAFAASRAEIGGLLLPATLPRKTPFANAAAWPVRPGVALAPALAQLARLLQGGALSVTTLQLVRGWALRELRDALHGMRRSLRHAGSAAAAAAARRSWAAAHRQARRGAAAFARRRPSPADRRGLAKYRLQAHYLRRRGLVRPGQLDAAVRTLARRGVEIVWVHGRFDAICPPTNSARWAAMGSRAGGPVYRARPACGHLAGEAPMAQALRTHVQRRL
ncbi:hypothetical protein C6568_11405 [Melaminivora suipulveris]|uniref:Proline iminopeptidase n=2 Tax=Melaminivora suipulveris TaxID=2109913 RepID=A0A2R3QDE1_9BURK|nr:hypothetical protein C6568_11405 [Melaminivora suipulveris]